MCAATFVYRNWPPRWQARVDLVLYFIFFFPGVLALVITGWKYAARSWSYGEVVDHQPGRRADLPVEVGDRRGRAPAADPGHRPGDAAACSACATGEWLAPEEDVRETDEILIEAAQAGEDMRRMIE